MKAERIASQREHVAKLPSAEDADGHLRFPFGCESLKGMATPETEGSGCAITRSVCSARNFRSASRMAACLLPRIAAASNAALTAPALPIASVPTGIPPGIWAMDSRESKPLRTFDSTGTPRTGRTVFDAAMPGRCAAPPAPAMMTSSPRCSADEAYSKSKSGVRCAETTRVSCGMPRLMRMVEACSMVSQSDVEPMMMPTRGLASLRSSWLFMEADILRLFSARCDLLALLPVMAKLADQIKRAGNENRIVGSGLGQRLVERLLGGRNHLETGSVVGCNFRESRSGDSPGSTRLGKDNFSGAGKELTSH